MRFWLGTHKIGWLERLTIPLFVSHRQLRQRKVMPRATAPWALDSGAFSYLSEFGYWPISASDYAASVDRYASEIGGLEWASPMDWMCEPFMVAKTGLSVAEHQRRTTESVRELRGLASTPIVPVLQGWELPDYLRHVDAYDMRGIDLTREPLVGLGSVCRRQSTYEAERIVREISALGIRLHAYGFKVGGLARCSDVLASSDSMAWSYGGRRRKLDGCAHRSCANCIVYAQWWRARVLRLLERPKQLQWWLPA